jgi:hypothetical protein
MTQPVPVVKLLVDSGAYSAFTQGIPVDIDQYANFIIKNLAHIEQGINLDVIMPTDVDTAARRSFENWTYLKDRHGLDTMPVFHCGESIEWLDKMIESTGRVGLSASMASLEEGIEWYNIVWPRITDKNGYPVAKFHAFGDAAPRAILNYPWYSADSTTWYVSAGLAGNMFINGRYVKFRTKVIKDGNYLSPDDEGIKRETWMEAFEAKGLNADLCINSPMRSSDAMLIRSYMNAAFFLDLQEQSRSCSRFEARATSLFGSPHSDRIGTPREGPIRLYFVITESTATRALAVLSQLGIRDILISHFYIGPKQWNELLVPYMYDPLKMCKEDPKLREQCEILAPFLRKPIIV